MSTLLTLFFTFFKIGLFTFGGGYAMLPLIQQEVARRGWMDTEELVNFVAVSESTPGPFAVNASTYVGARLAGALGAAAATLGVVLPSFLIILLVAHFYNRFRESRVIAGCMKGLKPASVGLIAAALLRIGSAVFFPAGLSLAACLTPDFAVSLVIFLLCAVLAFRKVNPIALIGISAALGIGAGLLLG